MIMEMDKFAVNDAHGNDDINIHNMNTLNNETKHGGNDTQFCNLLFI
jgi:polyhydroxyalkanoate synthesis regulator protein